MQRRLALFFPTTGRPGSSCRPESWLARPPSPSSTVGAARFNVAAAPDPAPGALSASVGGWKESSTSQLVAGAMQPASQFQRSLMFGRQAEIDDDQRISAAPPAEGFFAVAGLRSISIVGDSNSAYSPFADPNETDHHQQDSSSLLLSRRVCSGICRRHASVLSGTATGSVQCPGMCWRTESRPVLASRVPRS